MRAIIPVLALGLLLLDAGAAARADGPGDARAGIEATNGLFVEALARGDAAAVAQLYTPDALLLPPGRDPVEGRPAIAAYWQGAAEGIGGATLDTVEVGDHGDEAYEVGRYTLADPAGEPIDRGSYIVLWRRVQGAWRLHRDIWNSSVPVPAPAE